MRMSLRTSLKVTLLSVLAMLVLTTVAALALHFKSTILHGQPVLHQARVALLAWRLCLYTLIAIIWLSLRRKAKQRASQQLPVLNRLACTFIAMMILNELSCLLAWRAAL